MAHVTRHYISEVLQDVCNRLGDVTGSVFPEHRPTAVNDQMGELIVVSLPVSINDQKVWQKTTLRIELMVRNRSNGIAPTGKLGCMLDAVLKKFPMSNRRYSATKPSVVLKGDDGLGFTVWNVQALLIVNTTDCYVYVR